jgi:hypothetical protein
MTPDLDRTGEVAVRRIGPDPDDDVYVLPLGDLGDVRGWHVPARVVVDATHDDAPTLAVLAQIVLLRRRLRAAGGDLVIAASPSTAAALRSAGLHWAVSCRHDLSSALAIVRRAAGTTRPREQAN